MRAAALAVAFAANQRRLLFVSGTALGQQIGNHFAEGRGRDRGRKAGALFLPLAFEPADRHPRAFTGAQQDRATAASR